MENNWLVMGGMLVLVVVAVAFGAIQARRRRDALSALAASHNLTFDASPSDSVFLAFEGFHPFGHGSSRSARNLLSGRRDDIEWRAFDYRYTTGSGKNRRTHSYGIVAAALPLVFPRLEIRREGILDKVVAAVGFDDIDFESEEFSRRYCVKSDDRKFAYDLIHVGMMEFLLSARDRHWQLAGPVVLINQSGHFKPDEILAVMDEIRRFVSFVPAFVREDVSSR